MTPQFPFKGKYKITQGYIENKNNYAGGKHGALDIVPLDENGKSYPGPIYPIFNGSKIFALDNDPINGNGVKEKVECDKDFIAYLKTKNVVPKNHAGEVTLEILYWHNLDVLDEDGIYTQDTPIARCGNTGEVYSGGKPVPDNMKGKPPYPGLHLHLVTVLKHKSKIFNLDKDSRGRIDPQIILAYKGNDMAQVATQKKGQELRIVLKAADENQWKVLCAVYGKDPAVIDEQV